MTRTERLVTVVAEEFRARRTEIDSGSPIRSITVILTFNDETGDLYKVLYRTEAPEKRLDRRDGGGVG